MNSFNERDRYCCELTKSYGDRYRRSRRPESAPAVCCAARQSASGSEHGAQGGRIFDPDFAPIDFDQSLRMQVR